MQVVAQHAREGLAGAKAGRHSYLARVHTCMHHAFLLARRPPHCVCMRACTLCVCVVCAGDWCMQVNSGSGAAGAWLRHPVAVGMAGGGGGVQWRPRASCNRLGRRGGLCLSRPRRVGLVWRCLHASFGHDSKAGSTITVSEEATVLSTSWQGFRPRKTQGS